ncbi:septum formation initiator family protein [Streptomyces sp. ME08-AFT2]|uniref:septum formation initiator family protein n=1 Tax=Streptomyces sp. ME08-AFT2 TaxID=3028683 RepID=UPI0029A09995|nr:septum formation initiator family protein [Streptomyces sp. ME08-AFT2]MDX3310320.1 septum formation initiator family protein [Streptomyces sp. ME08-AFT2]
MSSRPVLKGRAARLARLFPAGPRQAARTPFVLLVVLLLGGGLIGLLVLNSALSEGSFKMDDLRKDTKSLTDEEQALQRDIDSYSAPDALQRRARELGMVPGGDPAFLNPDGTVKGVPSAAARQSVDPVVRPPETLTLSGTLPQTPEPADPGTSADSDAPGGASARQGQDLPDQDAAPARSPAPEPTAATPETPGR